MIDPANFSPYPKNPVIAKFFKEIGRVDELGSGVRNTFKYCRIYTPGTKPQFIEDDIFRTIILLKAKKSEDVVIVSDWHNVRIQVESGYGARPMKKEWVEEIQQQCHEANIKFFFKQWGGLNKKKNGRELNGRTYSEMPELTENVNIFM